MFALEQQADHRIISRSEIRAEAAVNVLHTAIERGEQVADLSAEARHISAYI